MAIQQVETKATGLWQSFAPSAPKEQESFWTNYEKLIAKSKKQQRNYRAVAPAQACHTVPKSTALPFVFSVDTHQKKSYLLEQFKQTLHQVMIPLAIAGCFLNMVLLLQKPYVLMAVFANLLGAIFCLSIFFFCFQKRISELNTLIEISPQSLTRIGGGFRSQKIHYYDIAEIRHTTRGMSIICYDSIHSKDRLYEALVIPKAFQHYQQAQALINHYWSNHQVKMAVK
ncbi:hypothetical protein [Microscilla marina]|uniref:DUF304 domain-containing protein n=1 Tax=Microscilla marina ATCC 23134 TaxID=313606 RepID=A1ZZJ5_MICM2|nr:hypothetical protein [Microscilla marina]EAY24190.1 hypothetical protein M23134_01778 [Microscilla marina ATCC 23134]